MPDQTSDSRPTTDADNGVAGVIERYDDVLERLDRAYVSALDAARRSDAKTMIDGEVTGTVQVHMCAMDQYGQVLSSLGYALSSVALAAAGDRLDDADGRLIMPVE